MEQLEMELLDKTSERVFFTADTHFGHKNIIKYCSRKHINVDEMDWSIIEAWNSVVRQNDRVYHLGDVAFSKPEKAKHLLYHLKGRIFLIKGNHDSKHFIKVCGDRFEWIKEIFELSMISPGRDKQKIVLCHFPLLTWNKSHRGAWHLHGHCHGTLPTDLKTPRLDVGIDSMGYVPVSYERIDGLLRNRVWAPIDHHGSENKMV